MFALWPVELKNGTVDFCHCERFHLRCVREANDRCKTPERYSL